MAGTKTKSPPNEVIVKSTKALVKRISHAFTQTLTSDRPKIQNVMTQAEELYKNVLEVFGEQQDEKTEPDFELPPSADGVQ